MNKKIIVTIVALVLAGFGVNLEKFGIDLGAILGGNAGSPTSVSTSAPASRSTTSTEPTRSSPSPSPSAHASGAKWSDTSPRINLPHIFEGEINRKGKPVGFHSRPGGKDPSTARVVRIKSKPNKAGVYTASIEVRDGTGWKEKFSSFFPDAMNRDQVVSAILHAYKRSADPKRQPWSGPSGHGFQIQGYTLSRSGDINTAFPVYKRD